MHSSIKVHPNNANAQNIVSFWGTDEDPLYWTPSYQNPHSPCFTGALTPL